MPKPEFSTRPSRTSKSKGISGWIQGRKERKKALAEQTAKIITDDTAKNETAIIDTLSSIDFIHSRLPEEVLEAKSNPNRPCGDLEYASKAICRMLLKNPQTLSLDLRKLDEKLLTISMLFKQSIEQGDKRAAFAAKAALVRGINDIRARIPANSPELFNQFIEVNAKYLDSISGRISQFDSAVEKLSSDVINSGLVKFFVDLGTTGVKSVDALVNTLTPLGTLAAGIGLLAGIKNVGIGMLVAY